MINILFCKNRPFDNHLYGSGSRSNYKFLYETSFCIMQAKSMNREYQKINIKNKNNKKKVIGFISNFFV